MSKGKVLSGLFATKDESLHRMLKKPIAGVYSMSNLTSFEPLVDSTIKTFLSELETRFVAPGKSCDWGTWLQYFAVSGNIRSNEYEEVLTKESSSTWLEKSHSRHDLDSLNPIQMWKGL